MCCNVLTTAIAGPVKRVKGDAKQEALIYVFNDFFLWCLVKTGKSDGSAPPLKLKSLCALQHTTASEMGELFMDVSYNPPDAQAVYTQRFVCSSAEVRMSFPLSADHAHLTSRRTRCVRRASHSGTQERQQWLKAIDSGHATSASQQQLADARRQPGGAEEGANKRERTMAPWQEQWSVDLEKFYYNKDTKEVAWELPQYLKQLLDEHGFLLDDPAVPKTVSTIVRISV